MFEYDARYNPDSTANREALAQYVLSVIRNAGFVEEYAIERGVRERVFFRELDNNPSIRVQVYTTIEGQHTPRVRECGDDAIRVRTLYRATSGKEWDIGRVRIVKRVGRFGDIQQRVLTAMRWGYQAGLDVPRCGHCGAPAFRSKKENLVCGELCWTKPRSEPRVTP